jgi:hypothetical protein
LLLLSGAAAIEAAPKKSVGLDVLPSLLELHASPGETIERSVTLTNPGEEALEVSAEAADWLMTEQGDVNFVAPGTNPSGCATWILVTPSTIRVPARGQARVSVRVRAAGELDGTRWAAVFFRLPRVQGFHQGSPADLVPRVALTVYVTGGTERESFEMTEVSAAGSPENVLLRARFDNQGNTAVRARMTWQIRSASGSVLRTNAATVVSLPRSRREAAVRVYDLPAGKYRVTAMAQWGNRSFRVRECALEVPRTSRL